MSALFAFGGVTNPSCNPVPGPPCTIQQLYTLNFQSFSILVTYRMILRPRCTTYCYISRSVSGFYLVCKLSTDFHNVKKQFDEPYSLWRYCKISTTLIHDQKLPSLLCCEGLSSPLYLTRCMLAYVIILPVVLLY